MTDHLRQTLSFIISFFILAWSSTAIAETLEAIEGFHVEEIYAVPKELGSWIRMTPAPGGKFIVARERGKLLRVTPPHDDEPTQVEQIEAPLKVVMGMTYVDDSLYANGEGPDGTALYRMRDQNQDGQYEDMQMMVEWGGYMHDHGPHEILLGPDGKLYLLNGNFVKVPEGVSEHSPHKNYQEDLLLPRQWDATGWAVGIMAPGASVYRTDLECRELELFCSGMRNPYGFDFNPEGELFAFDSDMERHEGTPWRRRTRVTHLVSGGEYGWRGGTGKGPTYYADNLPGTVEIGLSSPTGVRFGTNSNFPPKYKRALFCLDWQYGRILAVYLQRQGATYTGSFEEFVTGRPLSVTDLAFASDGSMLFITGGRGTQSKLYRVTYEGGGQPNDDSQPYNSPPTVDKEAIAARQQARHLESFHGQPDPRAVDEAWPYLDSSDRWLRYAARIAVEHQDVEQWRDRALTEQKTNASLMALLALARNGKKELLPAIIERLNSHSWDELTESQQLDLLRVYTITFTRMGPPNDRIKKLVTKRLDNLYPADSFSLNRELSELLVYLGAPDVISKTMNQFAQTEVQEEQMHFIFVLRHLTEGWTMEQREAYFKWFIRAVKFRGGISVPGFVRNIRSDALATLTPEEKIALDPILQAGYLANVTPTEKRKFVKKWKLEDFGPDLEKGGSLGAGRAVFEKAQCLACHHFGGEGGAVGPDITAVAKRFSRRDMLESILVPSKAVSEQYRDAILVTDSGMTVTGRIVRQQGDKLFVQTNPLDTALTTVLESEIEDKSFSTVSSMPANLLDTFTKKEIIDLIAYIESGADLKHRSFQ